VTRAAAEREGRQDYGSKGISQMPRTKTERAYKVWTEELVHPGKKATTEEKDRT